MSLSKPTSQTSVDISSSLTPPFFYRKPHPRAAASPVGSIADESSVWRSILDTHGREILECASRQFLDRATALRLETINTGDLNSLLAKAGRLRHNVIYIAEGNDVAGQTHNGVRRTQSCHNAHSISKAPDAGRHQGSGFTAPEPSPAEASHGPKRHRENEEGPRSFKSLRRTTSRPTRPGATTLDKRNGNNMRQRRECMRTRDQTHVRHGK
ncbi:hypothetical protein OIDMADRAFT_36506 [Oidiodendron maius Zn]|uniref:Uncharacterized protein n=1 Tax=Oidiodendron maius (strain Zn) TaxID=913774 RepID=A0A0C3GLY0_OIDMZ|nr:hypothetical protein OIDMADRAFT_36506 [Oidiodendron maius Zn]